MHRVTERPRSYRKPLGSGLGLVLVFSFLVIAPVHGAQQNGPEGFPDLVGGLQAIDGVLGVETATMASGKQVIFAWFESKEAVLRWYNSRMHRGVQQAFFPGQGFGTPLEGVPDDVGPVLAIASITMATTSELEETSLPISQIAIERYTPLSGGLYLGGRFAPDSLGVPNLKDYTPR